MACHEVDRFLHPSDSPPAFNLHHPFFEQAVPTNQVALSCVTIDVGNILHTRKHPHKSVFILEVNFRLVNVKQSAMAQLINQSLERSLVILSCIGFEVADSRRVQLEAKQPIQLAGIMYLWQSRLDVEVNGIAPDSRAKLAFAPACFVATPSRLFTRAIGKLPSL